MVTNDDGIDASGLRAPFCVLLSTNLYGICVCAPDSEKSAVSHSITWRRPVSAKSVVIDGAKAYAISEHLRRMIASELELQQTAHPSESQKHSFLRLLICIYFGTVAGACEAFTNDIPAVSLPYDCKKTIDAFMHPVKACLPVIKAVLTAIRNQTYPQRCFPNINIPTDVGNHKAYKLTNQGRSILKKVGWKQVGYENRDAEMLSTMSMQTNTRALTENELSAAVQDGFLFTRVLESAKLFVDEGTDLDFLQQGYIMVSPLGALSRAEADCQNYFREWLPSISEYSSTF